MDQNELNEIKRHFGITAVGLEHKIKMIAEGIGKIDKDLGYFQNTAGDEFSEIKSTIRFYYGELDRRIGFLENEIMSLKNRIAGLEKKGRGPNLKGEA